MIHRPDLLLPVHLVQPDPEGPARLSPVAPAEGAVPVDLRALVRFGPERLDPGPELHVFDTRMEAEAAREILEARGGPAGMEVAMLRDGEGVLAIPADGWTKTSPRVVDRRGPGCRERRLRGSWLLLPEEVAALSVPDEMGRDDLARAVVAKLSGLPGDVLRSLQTGLEVLPGAYVNFVSVSAEEIRNDWRLQDLDPERTARVEDRDIQAALMKANSKAELGQALEEAIEATLQRLSDLRPDIFGAAEEADAAASPT